MLNHWSLLVRLVLTISIAHHAHLMLVTKDDSSDAALPTATTTSANSFSGEDETEVGTTSSSKASSSSSLAPNKIPYKTVSPEDDEVHDDEIIEAVRNSLRLWKEGKLNKTHSHVKRVKRDEEVVCYGADLGCFRDEGPFDYLDMLPSPPEEIGTKFLFYSKEGEPEVYSYFNYTKFSLNGSKFNSSIPTKIIVHGFGSTCLRMWANEMRSALLSVVDCNVICVDWENGAALPNYVRAAVNTRLVGKQLSLLIRRLVADNPGTTYEDFHLIGFSLGAHVAGFTGQELKNISRITGLDPAGPLFENYDKRVRLDSTDAQFVDVIHSNGDSLLMGGLGSWEPIGHLDFYPNGGRVQKGCSNLFLGAFRDFIWSSPSNNNKDTVGSGGSDSRNGKSISSSSGDNDGRSLCNHRRAYKFFTESVSPRCPYPSFSCDSYDKFLTGSCFQWDSNLLHSAHMGFYADEHQLKRSAKQLGGPTGNPPGVLPGKASSSGGRNFYLMTRDDEPFCANQYKITLESSPPLGIPISTYGGVEAILINSNKEEFNETFLLTHTHKDNMISGSVLQKLIVAHPAINEPAKLVLKYAAYKGWIYSGISRWSLDRVIVTNAFGTSYSFCTRGLLLPSGISVTITLTKGVCTLAQATFPYRHPYLHHPPHHHHYGPHPLHLMPPSPMLRNELNDNLTMPQHFMGSLHHHPSHHSPLHPQQQMSPYSPTGAPQESNGGALNATSVPEFIDWSNDWHPIILTQNGTTASSSSSDSDNAHQSPVSSSGTEDTEEEQDKVERQDHFSPNDALPSSSSSSSLPFEQESMSSSKECKENCSTAGLTSSASSGPSPSPSSSSTTTSSASPPTDVEHSAGPINEIDHNNLSNEYKRSGRHLSGPPLLLMPLSRAIDPRPVVLRTSAAASASSETREREGRKLHSLTSPSHPLPNRSHFGVYVSS